MKLEIPALTLVLLLVLAVSGILELLFLTLFRTWARGPGRDVADWVDAIFFAIVLALTIRTLVFQLFKIPSGSMRNTLREKDHLIVNKFIFGWKVPMRPGRLLAWRKPRRGDIIVFNYPKDRSIYYIKRCVGTPGDTLELKNKILFVNGVAQDEPYAVHQDEGLIAVRDNFGPVTIPPGNYFMMGDNRDRSEDSRFWGFMPEEDIQGLAWFIYWPLARVGRVPALPKPLDAGPVR